MHGDFDVDGVSATALMISTLRELGADCDWLIPAGSRTATGSAPRPWRSSRSGDRTADHRRLRDHRGRAGRAGGDLGMEVIVTDHHQPDEELPDCLILHPESRATRSRRCAGRRSRQAGLRAPGGSERAEKTSTSWRSRPWPTSCLCAARTVAGARGSPRWPGARAGPAGADGGFAKATERAGRGGPRLPVCAADQRGRPHAPCGCRGRAAAHRRPERARGRSPKSWSASTGAPRHRARGRRGGGGARRGASEELRTPGVVVAGDGWHPGVVGIVASRMVERHNRPSS